MPKLGQSEHRGWKPNENYHPHPLDRPGHDLRASGNAGFVVWTIISSLLLMAWGLYPYIARLF